MLTEKLMSLTISGGSEWVMIVLLLLSVISVSIMIERALFFRSRWKALRLVEEKVVPLIAKSELKQIRQIVENDAHTPLKVAVSDTARRDRDAAEKLVTSALEYDRLSLERRLTFLGTLGNNAPFIGLFGTVLGIIKAFHVLSLGHLKGTSAVMSGISEALVATAVGLFVALPAVIAFNYFQRQVDRILSVQSALALSLIAEHSAKRNSPSVSSMEAV